MLFGSPQPEVLPSNGTRSGSCRQPDVGAVAMAKFQRLVLGDRDRGGASQTRVRLFGDRFSTPSTVVITPNQKLPASETQSRGNSPIAQLVVVGVMAIFHQLGAITLRTHW